MAKKKVEKPNKRSNKIRRTILGTLSGVFMISALIVAAIPVKDVRAVDETDAFTENSTITNLLNLNDDATNGIPTYTGSNVFIRMTEGLELPVLPIRRLPRELSYITT